MSTLAELIDKSTSSPNDPAFVTPTIVGTVIGPGGKILFQHASGFGHTEHEAVTPDHVFGVASCSKLMCTVAVMQTVERGLIGLDDDLADLLPDLAKLEVLDGNVDERGIPTTKKRRNRITLRLLLSHSSGLGSEAFPTSLAQYCRAIGFQHKALLSDQVVMKSLPLAFEPGTGWIYGTSIDWAGETICRLHQTTLEEYYQKNIWTPLDMKHTTFHPRRFKDLMVMSYHRLPDGGIAEGPLVNPLDPPIESAGHGVFTTPNDYAKLLGAVLDGGGPILSSKSVDEIFTPQLPNTEWLTAVLQGPYKRVLGPSIPRDQEVNHGLAGLVNLHDFPGRRSAGTLQWAGSPNLIWWIDRKKNVAGSTFLQIIPPGDLKGGQFNIEFEEAVYKNLPDLLRDTESSSY